MTLSNLATVVFYIVTFCTILLLGYIAHKKQKGFLSVILVFLPAIIVALRFQTGSDTENYKDIYDSINAGSFDSAISQFLSLSFEPYTILSARLSELLGYGYFFYFLAHSLLTFTACFYASKKIDHDRWWLIYTAISIIMLPYCLNVMRQALATSLFLLLILLLVEERKNWLLILSSFTLMVFCHFSSILLLPVLFLYPLAKTKKFESRFVTVFVAIIASLVVFPFIFSFASRNALLPPKYLEAIGVSKFNLLNFDFVIFLAIATFLFITRKFKNSYGQKHNQYISFVILCNLFYAGIGFFSAYIGRMSDYFWPIAVIGIWFAIDRFKDSFKLKSVVYLGLIVLYFVLSSVVLGNNQIIPYGVM